MTMNIAGAPKADADLIKDTTTQAFTKDVLEASREVAVLVDFWAPWCGPCKQLTPILEKAVRAAKGKVRLVKMNIDEHPAVAGQLGVQSIPAVFAFRNGRPVDGFMGALPEGQVKAFIDRLLGGEGPGADLAEMLKVAGEALEQNDLQGAAEIYAAILADDKENPDALAGLAKCYLNILYPICRYYDAADSCTLLPCFCSYLAHYFFNKQIEFGRTGLHIRGKDTAVKRVCLHVERNSLRQNTRVRFEHAACRCRTCEGHYILRFYIIQYATGRAAYKLQRALRQDV